MKTTQRLKSLPPPLGTQARQRFDQQKRGYRYVEFRGSTVKETLNRKTGVWSKGEWVSKKQLQRNALAELTQLSQEMGEYTAPPETFTTVTDTPPG